jgi:hypothetical protein
MPDEASAVIIKTHPTGEALNAFRSTFSLAYEDLHNSGFLYNEIAYGGCKGNISSVPYVPSLTPAVELTTLLHGMIHALQGLPAARLLSSGLDNQSLHEALSVLDSLVDQDDCDFQSLIPLVAEMMGGGPDEVIWDSARTAISECIELTPSAKTPMQSLFRRLSIGRNSKKKPATASPSTSPGMKTRTTSSVQVNKTGGMAATPVGKLYQPLKVDAASPQIRLLSVRPASDPSTEINCTLCTTALATAPEYQALSYVWGDTTDPAMIK